jgi:hypothetical protein
LKRLLLGLVLFTVIAAGGTAYAATAVAAYICPGCYGFARVAPYIYAEKGHDARAAVAAIETAKARVSMVLGWGDESPTILICATQTCANRLGPGPRAMVYGRVFFYLNPTGANVETLAHELAHIRIHSLIGTVALLQGRLPAWWDEGMATLIEGVQPSAKGFADGNLPSDSKLWRKQAARDHAVMYPAAAAKVTDWLQRNNGYAGAMAMLHGLRRGAGFPG